MRVSLVYKIYKIVCCVVCLSTLLPAFTYNELYIHELRSSEVNAEKNYKLTKCSPIWCWVSINFNMFFFALRFHVLLYVHFGEKTFSHTHRKVRNDFYLSNIFSWFIILCCSSRTYTPHAYSVHRKIQQKSRRKNINRLKNSTNANIRKNCVFFFWWISFVFRGSISQMRCCTDKEMETKCLCLCFCIKPVWVIFLISRCRQFRWFFSAFFLIFISSFCCSSFNLLSSAI